MKDGVRIRELQPSDSFANFSLAPEDERLENFFKQDSKEYQRLLLACTYVFVEEERILGAISLVCSDIYDTTSYVRDTIELEGVNFPRNNFPAVKIARLAVDKEHQKKGIGTQLVDFSIKRASSRWTYQTQRNLISAPTTPTVATSKLTICKR